MGEIILAAVNDSPAAFAAADVAIEQARRLGARLHIVTVIEGGEHWNGSEVLASRRKLGADAVLGHVAALGAAAGVEITGRQRTGRVAAEILDEARVVGAMMIVLARVDRPGHAIPSIGSHTLRVLEFATVPVLVVPTG